MSIVKKRKKIIFQKELMRPLTLGVMVIMIITTLILQFFLEKSQNAIAPTEDFNTFFSDVFPSYSSYSFNPEEQFFFSEQALLSQEFSFFNKAGEETFAFISKPKGSGPFPVIVIVHDAPASQRITQRVSSMIGESLSNQQNAIVMVIDWKEGAVADDDVGDVLAGLDWIIEKKESKPDDVVIAGIGYGAYLAFLASAEKEVAGIVSIGGYVNPAEVFDALEEKNKKKSSLLEETEQFLLSMGCETVSDRRSCLEQLSAMEVLSKETPILALHATTDPIIPFSQMERFASLDPTRVTLAPIETSEPRHDLLGDNDAPEFEKSMNQVNDWIREILGTAPQDTQVYVVFPQEEKNQEENSTEESSNADSKKEREPIYVEFDAETLLDNASDL